ncbi:C40 family peptidase [Hymenobacter artigasi]|uniref:NlpC/P60 domain-containing protein n=1 Tax=Hymenobacter artigasi TaxID=2719616 RepID=A0ABX1HGZ2_9BACT|nr:C40 family peptidase [Hymenobacter artigasi]NKI89129.1 hypothetical protein [Hymenobacter artigasi]
MAETSQTDAALRARPASLRTSSGSALPPRADSVVAFGLAQRGTPYVYAGTSPLTGFDCSGFIMYTFAHFGVPVPHSTALLIDVGRPVARAEAQPGDIVVFTGTAATSNTPGHAGIVISARGELPLRFVHASSSRREPFVKVNQVENSDYERRFMQVRRVLGPGTGIAATARPKLLTAPASTPPVAALPTRQVAVAAVAAPVPALPKRLATKKYPTTAITAKQKSTTKRAPAKAAVAAKKKSAAIPRRKRPATKAR